MKLDDIAAYLPIAFLLIGGFLLTSCSSSAFEPGGAALVSDVSVLPSSTPSMYPDRIVLTWAEDPSSSLSVSWRTDESVSSGQAQIALARAEPSFYTQARTVEASTESLHSHGDSGEHMEANYHSVTFEGLEADTMYAYRVGDGEHWSEWFHARTGSDEPEPFSFIYFGDVQNNVRSHWSRVIRGAYSHSSDIDFMIHAGDLVNNAHRNLEWGHWNEAGGWIQSMIPNVPVPGNHEYDALEGEESDQLSIHWHPQFTLPRNGPEGMKETVYYIDYQGMRIIGLNTNIRDSVRLERQTDWLEQTLEEADTRWTVVTMHHPMFSSGEGRSNEELRKKWTPIFDEHRVDLVMQGHDHTYARGQMKNLPQGVNTRSPIGGTVYVNSVSGAKMYEIKADRWERYEGIEMERGGENTQLFQVVHVYRDTMKYRSYTATGETYDAFNLLKRPGDTPNEMNELPVANTEERTHENTLDYARP